MSSSFLILCFLISLGLNTTQAADPDYLYHNCTNYTTTFTPNSIYQSNLNHLLSVLSSNAIRESYNATAGNDPSTAVYSLFLCRGDMNPTACRNCVQFADKDADKWCLIEKQMIIVPGSVSEQSPNCRCRSLRDCTVPFAVTCIPDLMNL